MAESKNSFAGDTTQSDSTTQTQRPQLDPENGKPSIQPPADGQVCNDPFLVKFADGDPENPMNFSGSYKAWLTAQMALLAFVGSFGSSIPSPAEPIIAEYLNVNLETTVLLVSLFVLGYAFGPMLWAPISEVYGRKISMLPAIFTLGLFSIGTAVSSNAASVFVTRFFGGLFGSAAISNVSAAIGDFYPAKTRGVPMALMAVCVIGGPCLAPLAGAGVTVNPHLGWRWTEYIQAIITFAVVTLTLFCLPETYAPVLLKQRARRLRKETGEQQYWHPHEKEKINLNNILTKYIARPSRMLVTEPMVTCMAIYASFVYGLLFFQLESFPIVFEEERGWGLVTSTLPFLGLFVGVLIALTINIANQPFYTRAVAKNKHRAVPEARLPPMVVGGVLFSVGLFWFGWTAAERYSWVLPVVAAGLIGAGFNIIFQQCLNFLVDTYGPYAASAMAGNTLLRSLLACGLPLAARPMFLNLGVGPACSLLGGISCLALPVPFIFMKYGLKLRKMSKLAPVIDD